MIAAAELVGRGAQLFEKLVHNLRQRLHLKGERVDELRLNAKPRGAICFVGPSSDGSRAGRTLVNLVGEGLHQAVNGAARASVSARLPGMSHIRTSTVPKLWCGRTSHQISRIVSMNPVLVM